MIEEGIFHFEIEYIRPDYKLNLISAQKYDRKEKERKKLLIFLYE